MDGQGRKDRSGLLKIKAGRKIGNMDQLKGENNKIFLFWAS